MKRKEYWPQDITWCMNNDCKEKRCMRNPIHITDRRIPHSFAYCEGTEDCYKMKPEVEEPRMKVADVAKYIYDKVVIYRNVEVLEFEDLYKGYIDDAPEKIKKMVVCSIGAKRKGVVDIEVES